MKPYYKYLILLLFLCVGPWDRALAQAISQPDVFFRGDWVLPVATNHSVIHTPRSSGPEAKTTFLVDPFSPVVAPAEGRLLYKGPINSFETGFVLLHPGNLFSIVSSPIDWERSDQLSPGDPIVKGQFLAAVRGGSFGAYLGRRPVIWRVFDGVDKVFSGVQDWDRFLGTAKAKQAGLSSSDDLLKGVLSGRELNTKQLLNLGTVQFNWGEDNLDTAVVTLEGKEILLVDLIQNAMLLAGGLHDVTVTSGRIFKTVKRQTIVVTAAGTHVQWLGKTSSGDVHISRSEFLPGAAAASERIAAKPVPSGLAAVAAVLPSALLPCSDGVDQVNCVKPSAQADTGQDQARQLALADAAARQADAERLAEQVRLMAEKAETERTAAVGAKAARDAADAQADEARVAREQAQARRDVEARANLAEQARARAEAESSALREQLAKAQEAAASLAQARLAEQARAKAQADAAAATAASAGLAVLAQQAKADAQTTVYANRRALVIGNDNYRHVAKLLNAREDAKAIADNLKQFGYQVTLKLDLTEKDMKAALRTFKNQVEGGDEVMVFFAGHGVQLGSTNYLLPTDITGESEDQIKDDAIQLQRVLDDMSEKKAKLTLALIDACRDNPFKTAQRAIGGRGLAPTTAATGQMVIFSAGTGQQALDKLGPADTNRNGLFTRVFLKEMQKTGVSIDKVLRNVRTEVVGLARAAGHEQVPAIYDQVVGDFYFRR